MNAVNSLLGLEVPTDNCFLSVGCEVYLFDIVRWVCTRNEETKN